MLAAVSPMAKRFKKVPHNVRKQQHFAHIKIDTSIINRETQRMMEVMPL